MRVLIDTCVLYPTVLRELVLAYAATGAFTPLWSERILEEWRRASGRHSDKDAAIAKAEIALAKDKFQDAMVSATPATTARLSLPDPDDIHVLAAAVDGEADALLTLNLKDFPTRTLANEGIFRREPDGFLLEGWHNDEETLHEVVEKVLARAQSHGIDTTNPRALLKRARLPRLGKALYPR